jgi:hypothetical protein
MLRIDKKLREARFFLRKMGERAQIAFGEHEEFDFYLSAFLSAGRSVDYRLRHEQGAAYVTFRAGWEKTLSPDDQCLVKALVDDRNVDVHESGSSRTEGEGRIPVIGGRYRDRSGVVTVRTPPGTPPSVIVKPEYCFVVRGQQIPVLEAPRRYIELLERLVSDYRRSQGVP